MVVARGTAYNHGVDSVALRSHGENQLLARSENNGASPLEDSSADVDNSASSSMGSNDTYGSVAALLSYEARKEGLVKAFKGGVHQESMPRFSFQGQYGLQESGSADGTECRRGPARRVRISGLLPHHGAAASKIHLGGVRDAPPDRGLRRLRTRFEGCCLDKPVSGVRRRGIRESFPGNEGQ